MREREEKTCKMNLSADRRWNSEQDKELMGKGNGERKKKKCNALRDIELFDVAAAVNVVECLFLKISVCLFNITMIL